MKKNRKRFAASVLALSMMLFSLPVTAFADETPTVTEGAPVSETAEVTAPAETETPPVEPQTPEETAPAEGETEQVSGETAAPAEETDTEDYGIMPASLLPLEVTEAEVTLQRDNPYVYANKGLFTVREVLDSLVEKGVLESDCYGKTISYAEKYSDSYRYVTPDDEITSGTYYNDYDGKIYLQIKFLIGNGDQLDINNKEYDITIRFAYPETDVGKFARELIFTYFDCGQGNAELGQSSYLLNNSFGDNDGRIYDSYVSAYSFSVDNIENSSPGIFVTLPVGYSADNVRIYKDYYYDETSLADAQDITAAVLKSSDDQQPYGLEFNYSYSYDEEMKYFMEYMTFAVDNPDGSKLLVPVTVAAAIWQKNYSTGNSDDTYFTAYAPSVQDDEAYGGRRYTSGYGIYSNDDYYENGYQTILILDGEGNPVEDNTVIYPDFYYYKDKAKVNLAGSSELQIPQESPVIFKSSEPLQYTVAATNGTELSNYWVTYVTQQPGAKLFVNATNNPDHFSKNGKPQREVFLYDSYDKHDILIANIGSEPLNGITATLSEDTQGVKLNDYWSIHDDSVKTLAPFTDTSDPENIAKVRLELKDDTFGPVSGTLTIASANGGSVDIDLTGIAGTPSIVTDQLYEGVKYIPYQSIIMSNCMYESDAMKFSLVSGELPDGIELHENGELYGIPTETGEFTFTVQAVYNGSMNIDSSIAPAVKTFTLIIKDNTDENVDAVNSDEQGYSLEEQVSKYITVYYSGENRQDDPFADYIQYSDNIKIEEIVIDNDIFRSEGELEKFRNFYIDGMELSQEDGEYYAESGSTRITVNAQTFSDVVRSPAKTPHTLAAEFVENENGEIKRSGQNIYLNYVYRSESVPSNPGQGGSGGQGSAGTGGTGSTGSTGGVITPVINETPKHTSETVTVSMTVTDENGAPVSDLAMELRSAPKRGKTDSSGNVKFNSVEFGRHTIYITDPDTGKKITKVFTIKSGEDTEKDGNVITAEPGGSISLSISYDGKSISILSAENIQAGSGMTAAPDSDSAAPAIAVILMFGAAAAFAVKRRHNA